MSDTVLHLTSYSECLSLTFEDSKLLTLFKAN